MADFIKRFPEWMPVKSELDGRKHLPPLFKEREVWWCSIGENVGVEISGKGLYFRRPVLVLRKLDAFTFIGVPLTRTARVGSWYEQTTISGMANTVIIGQARYFDYRRMDKILCTIKSADFKRIKNPFVKMILENRSPALGEAGGRGEYQI